METHKYLEKYFNGFLTSEEIMLTDITSKNTMYNHKVSA